MHHWNRNQRGAERRTRAYKTTQGTSGRVEAKEEEMGGCNEMCVLIATAPALFAIFTFSAAVRKKLGPSIAQGPLPGRDDGS